MKQIRCLLVLILLLSPFARAIAEDSAAAVTKEIAKLKQDKIESANGFEADRKKLDASIADYMKQRGEEEPFLRDHTKVANGQTVADGASAIISRIDKTLTQLRSDRAKLMADSRERQSQLDNQIRTQQSRLFELQHPMTNSWGNNVNLHSPDSEAVPASSSAASSSSGQATASEKLPSYNNHVVLNAAAANPQRENNPAPKPVLLAQAAPIPTLTQPAATKLSGEDKLTLATLNDIIEDMNKPTEDAAKRTKLLNEFLTQSEPFVASHPDYTNLWVVRATAAMETDNAEAGWKAGQQLKRLNVLDGDDTKALKAMSGLKRKGWLTENLETVKNASQLAKKEERLNNLDPDQRKMIGNWTFTDFGRSSNPNCYMFNVSNARNKSGSLTVYLADDGALHIRGNANTDATWKPEGWKVSCALKVKDQPLPRISDEKSSSTISTDKQFDVPDASYLNHVEQFGVIKWNNIQIEIQGIQFCEAFYFTKEQ